MEVQEAFGIEDLDGVEVEVTTITTTITITSPSGTSTTTTVKRSITYEQLAALPLAYLYGLAKYELTDETLLLLDGLIRRLEGEAYEDDDNFVMENLNKSLNDSVGPPKTKRPRSVTEEIDIIGAATYEGYIKDKDAANRPRNETSSFDFNKKINVKLRLGPNELIDAIARGTGNNENEVIVTYNTANGAKQKSIPLAMLAVENKDILELSPFLPESQEIELDSQDSMKEAVQRLPTTSTPLALIPEEPEPVERRKTPDGKDIYDSHEFHYIQDTLGKRRLIIIIDFFKDRCYAFGKNMGCLGCKAMKKNTIAWFSDNMKEVFVDPDSHVCVERSYREEMNSLSGPHLIAGKPFDLERYGHVKYPEEQLEHRIVFDGKKLIKKLILFVDESHDQCYECTWVEQTKLFRCVGCDSAKPRKGFHIWTKKDDEGETAYTRDSHVCEPREYNKVIEKLEKKQKEKIMIGPDDFEIVEHLDGKNDTKQNLVIKHKDDKAKCYVYYRNRELYLCLGCSNFKKNISAKFFDMDGTLLVIADDNHVCDPRKYEEVMEKLLKNVPEDVGLCVFKTFIRGKKELQQLEIYSDNEKRFGYKFGIHKRNYYKCLGCISKNVYTLVTVNESNGEMVSAIRNREHVCQPTLLQLPQLPTTPELKRLSWSITPEGLEALAWLKTFFNKFGRGSCSMCAAYFLSTAPPTSDAETILANKVYDGYSSLWKKRAWKHFNGGKWDDLIALFGALWMYPYLIDESSICEEMEALMIALFYAGSLPEFMLQNTRRESFKLFDAERGVYFLEEIATDPSHPDHAKLVLACNTYLLRAAQSQSLKENAINLKDAEQFSPNGISESIAYF